RMQTAAIGPATAERLLEFGLTSDIVPETYRAESVVEAFEKVKEKYKIEEIILTENDYVNTEIKEIQ
ncbi:MAG: uroporphyrinogen-III synthase, partial [Bacteroidota bacterium]|nr:uroporphyrinogen-III synthase [Bacteroidota bacterium]